MYVSLCQHCYRHIITGYQWILYSQKLLISRIFKNFHHSQAPPKNLVKAQKFYYKFFREKITVLKILVLEILGYTVPSFIPMQLVAVMLRKQLSVLIMWGCVFGAIIGLISEAVTIGTLFWFNV